MGVLLRGAREVHGEFKRRAATTTNGGGGDGDDDTMAMAGDNDEEDWAEGSREEECGVGQAGRVGRWVVSSTVLRRRSEEDRRQAPPGSLQVDKRRRRPLATQCPQPPSTAPSESGVGQRRARAGVSGPPFADGRGCFSEAPALASGVWQARAVDRREGSCCSPLRHRRRCRRRGIHASRLVRQVRGREGERGVCCHHARSLFAAGARSRTRPRENERQARSMQTQDPTQGRPAAERSNKGGRGESWSPTN